MNHIDPKEEVLAETPIFDGGLEIAVGGGDDPNIDRHLRRCADGTNGALLKHAEKLGLEANRHVTDLVQEDVPRRA